MVLLGIGAVWVGKHAPVPSNHPSAAQLARERKAELAYRALQRRIRAGERRRRALERARVRWARGANRICGSIVRADRAALRRVERTTSLAEAFDILSTAEAQGRGVMDKLAALPRPRGRTGRRVRSMLDLYEKAFAYDQAASRGRRPVRVASALPEHARRPHSRQPVPATAERGHAGRDRLLAPDPRGRVLELRVARREPDPAQLLRERVDHPARGRA